MVSTLTLTEMELRFAVLLCDGLSHEEIAKKMFRSAWTVNGYRERLIKKTNAKNSVHAIAILFKDGIL